MNLVGARCGGASRTRSGKCSGRSSVSRLASDFTRSPRLALRTLSLRRDCRCSQTLRVGRTVQHRESTALVKTEIAHPPSRNRSPTTNWQSPPTTAAQCVATCCHSLPTWACSAATADRKPRPTRRTASPVQAAEVPSRVPEPFQSIEGSARFCRSFSTGATTSTSAPGSAPRRCEEAAHQIECRPSHST
jgi:hypothetical protein